MMLSTAVQQRRVLIVVSMLLVFLLGTAAAAAAGHSTILRDTTSPTTLTGTVSDANTQQQHQQHAQQQQQQASRERRAQERIEPIQLHGINYNTRKGPDWFPDETRCKSYDEIMTELTLLRQITSRIRILSITDCNQAALVLQVLRSDAFASTPMQVWLGLWVSDDAAVFARERDALEWLVQNGQVDVETSSRIPEQGDPGQVVLGITVGSEAIYRNDTTATQMIQYKDQVKAMLREYVVSDANNMIPVAIVDVDDIYEEFPDLFESSDAVFVNAFPFWENFISIEDAASYLVNEKITEVLWVAEQLGNKPFILGETGWSESGYNVDSSPATPENAARYFQDFYCMAHLQAQWAYYWFTGIDNTWRIAQNEAVNGLDTVEGHFGLFDSVSLELKPQFRDLAFTCPDDPDVEYRFVLSDDDGTDNNTPTQQQQPSSPAPATGMPTPAPQATPVVLPTNSPGNPPPAPTSGPQPTTPPPQPGQPSARPSTGADVEDGNDDENDDTTSPPSLPPIPAPASSSSSQLPSSNSDNNNDTTSLTPSPSVSTSPSAAGDGSDGGDASSTNQPTMSLLRLINGNNATGVTDDGQSQSSTNGDDGDQDTLASSATSGACGPSNRRRRQGIIGTLVLACCTMLLMAPIR